MDPQNTERERGRVICTFGITPPTTPRDTVCLTGLKKLGYRTIECHDDSPGLRKYVNLIRKHRAVQGKYDLLFVTYTSQLAVPLARILSRKKVVFNALSPLHESVVLDRKAHSRFSPVALLYWLADFLSFHCAHLVLLETNAQIDYVVRTYHVRRAKCVRLWTSADGGVFTPSKQEKSSRFTVFFRGVFLPFVGIETVIEAARLLKNDGVHFHIMGRGERTKEVQALVASVATDNIKLDMGFLDINYILNNMRSAHVSLGQFSCDERVQRTITHKTFETLALGLPFITARSHSSQELLKEGENCLYTTCGSARDLADKILQLKSDPALRERMGRNNRILFEQKLSADAMARDIEPAISALIER